MRPFRSSICGHSKPPGRRAESHRGAMFIPDTINLCAARAAMAPAILTGEQRLQSTFTHPNIYAFFIVRVVTVILFMTCSTTVTLSKFMRRMMFIYAGYFLILLLLTKTRSAWLSMVIIMTGYAIVVDRR